ncbi:stomatin-like protein 1 isoform X3 [Cavia porcellus]|uniref:stomatin-like protein 1 isoform X3 n=1 Tax=Cavia porcellus TaxID=10141 RepID=UPI002FDF6405
MLDRAGYRALPLGDFDRFQQSSLGFLGAQKGCLSPERGSVGPGADVPQSWSSCLCHGIISFLGFLLLLLTFPISGWFALKIVPTYERMIVFRLGRIRNPQGPGMVLLLPFIDSFQRVDLRTRAFNIPPCKLEINEVTRAWGLEVDRVELAVEAVLQPPHDSPAGPSLDSTLQQLTLHLLGRGTNSMAGGALPPRPALAATPVDTLEMVREVEQSAIHTEAWTGPSPMQPVAEGLLTALQPFLSEVLVSQVGACYQFNIILPGGTQSTYFLDLTTAGQGRVGRGTPDRMPDVVVEMAEADLQALLCRELRPLGAYMSGRLQVKGDLAVAMKLEAVLQALK